MATDVAIDALVLDSALRSIETGRDASRHGLAKAVAPKALKYGRLESVAGHRDRAGATERKDRRT
jgi:hypothetical protein